MRNKIKKSELKQLLSIIGIVGGIVVLLVGLVYQWWKLSEISTAVVSAIVGAIILLFVWGFKDRFQKPPSHVVTPAIDSNSQKEAIACVELNIIFNPNELDTYTPSRSYRTLVIGETIYKKFMRVKIENKGNAIAKRCDAKLRVLTDNKDGTNPSTDSKPLPWDSGGLHTYIGVNNDAMLDVIFSNSREVVDSKANSLRKVAFISTRESKNPRNIYFPRIEDGFNIGDYKVRLTIRDESGASAEAFFVIHVTEEWYKISMERIQSS